MKKIFFKISFIIFFSFLISFGVDTIYRHIYHLKYEFPQNMFILPEIQEKYDIVKLGNSHSESGIRFERFGVKSLSLASVAQPFEYDLAYLKMHARQIKKGAVIIIPVSPLSFSQKKAGKEDSLQTNYYDGRISPFLIPNINIGDYLESRIFPFLRSGYLMRDKNKQEIQKRISKEEQWPDSVLKAIAQETETAPIIQTDTINAPLPNPFPFLSRNVENKPKNAVVESIEYELQYPTNVPSDMHKKSVEFMVKKWYNENEFSSKYFQTNRRDLEKIIEYCLKKEWRPVLITIPVTQLLLDNLKPDYMQRYVYDNLEKMNLHGVDYFDFMKNRQLTTNKFLYSNADHLTERGASIFSYILLQTLIEKGYLPREVDLYK